MRKLLLGSCAAVLAAFTLASCFGDEFSSSCQNSLDCKDAATGGAAGSGGTNTAGTTSTGASGGSASTCETECKGSKPVCDDGTCVECTEDDDTACEDETPYCDPDKRECVECLDNDACGDDTPLCEDNVCVGCSAPEDCAPLDLAQCLPNGKCVACTSEADCDDKVCDPTTNTCTTLPAHTLNACETCEHDAQCQVGQVCVEMKYADPAEGVVGSFCFWKKDAAAVGAPNGTCGLNSRPFASQLDVTSVDGVEATICTLATTTCPAMLQFRTTVTGCSTPGTDDVACGASDFNDGRCRLNGASQPKCTYPCSGNEDCKPGFTCPATGDQYCSL